jgi:hypothetical protein
VPIGAENAHFNRLVATFRARREALGITLH